MQQGLTLTQMAAELEARARAKADFVVDTRELTLITPPKTDGEKPEAAAARRPEIHLPEGVGEYSMSDHAQRQLADRLGYPAKLWDRFRESHPDLLDHDVNALLRREPERRTIRCYDWPEDRGGPVARAVLSDRYRRMDYEDLAQTVFPLLHQLPGVQFPSCQITENRMYIKAVIPGLQGEVRVGDVVQAGLIISNSEVGQGSLSVRTFWYRLWCTNGCGHEELLRQVHLGRAVESDETYRILQDDTRAADDKALQLKLRDVVTAGVSETRFNALLASLREAATGEKAPEPQMAMEKLAKKLDLSEGEAKSAFTHLITGSANGTDGRTDFTPYGFLNAVTRTAADLQDYDRATELEVAGGRVLQMAGTREWAEVIAV